MPRRSRQVPPKRGNHAVEQHVLAVFREHEVGLEDLPVVVGLSGGTDSLATLMAVLAVAPSVGVPVTALHIDHGLRPESGAEADRVVEMGGALGVPVDVVRLEPGLAGRHRGVGIEGAARRERYLAARIRCGGDHHFVTGHHADDQAETILMHLARGAGATGASGMRPLTGLPVPWWAPDDPRRGELSIFRPVLGLRRSELAAYVAGKRPDLVPLHDPSNDDPSLSRNAIRLRVIPALEDVYPGATVALSRFGEIIAADDLALTDLAATMTGVVHRADGSLDRRVADAPEAIGRRLLMAWLTTRVPTADLSQERITTVWRAIEAGGPFRQQIGGGSVVRGLLDRVVTEPATREVSER